MRNPVPVKQMLENRYVLVVDNKSSDLFTCSMLLQRFEYRVCTASTAGQALEMISVAIPSLVITDSALPGMSGMDLLSLLKQDVRTDTVPVIFLNPADTAAERRYLESGACAVVAKPIEVEALYRAVQLAVESHPRANIRIPAKLSVSVNNVPLDDIEGECASVLSEHGLYVRMRKPYERDEQVHVELKVNGRVIPARAAVLYCHRFDDGPFCGPGMGLKFIDIATHDREFIKEFIRSEITRGLV